MALAKLLPQLRPLDQALAEMQFRWGRTKIKIKRRTATRAEANNSGLTHTSERLFSETAMETKGDEKKPRGPERYERRDINWKKVHNATAQA